MPVEWYLVHWHNISYSTRIIHELFNLVKYDDMTHWLDDFQNWWNGSARVSKYKPCRLCGGSATDIFMLPVILLVTFNVSKNW